MMVRFLGARSWLGHCGTYPLRVFESQLRQVGLTVKVHYRPDESLVNCHVVCVTDEFFRQTRLNRTPPNRNELLEWLRPRVQTIVWIDETGGTGQTCFGVMPLVDLYAKSALLADRQLYTEQLYSNRYHRDYYHRTDGIEDEVEDIGRRPARPEEINKLAVAWNYGLGDFHTFTRWGRRFRRLWPWVDHYTNATPVDENRDLDVSFRARTSYKQATVSFQRQETARQLAEIATNSEYNIVYQGKLPYREYKNELSNTAIAPSPFGLSEINYRDFETFLAGATLLKPDMSHMETWPDYYAAGVTYVPHSWDFSDFQEQLVELLESRDRRLKIADAGQKRYLASLSPDGGRLFAEHFAALVQRAIENSTGDRRTEGSEPRA